MNKELKRKKSAKLKSARISKKNKHPAASSKDDSIEIKNKTITEKKKILVSNDSVAKNSNVQVIKEKETPVDDTKIEKLSKETEIIIKIVSEKLKPDMEISIKNHFDAMRSTLLNEIKEIRKMIENGKGVPDLELPHIDTAQAVPPQNMPKLSGQTNSETRQNPTSQNQAPVKQGSPIASPEVIGELLKLVPELLKKKSEPDPFTSGLMQLMQKKMINDMGRSDTQGTALTNYLIKRLMKTDPDLFSETANTLMD